jgi:hypothetical protein
VRRDGDVAVTSHPPDFSADFSADRLRFEHDWQAERDRERRRAGEPRQEPLPFGDGFLDDDELVPEIHGSALGVRRHLAAGETPCPVCREWIDELVAAGFAAPYPNEKES